MAGYEDLLAKGFELPFSYRLGQYLLGMGDVFGDVNKSLLASSKVGQESLEGLERTRIAEDTLAERRREADLKNEEALYKRLERQQLERTKGLRRSGLSKFLNIPPTEATDVPTQVPSGQLPQDASDLEAAPDVMTLLKKGSRKLDFSEASQRAQLDPEEWEAIGDEKSMAAIKSLFPGPDKSRYVSTASGDILDTTTGQVVPSPSGPKQNLKEVGGVMYDFSDPNRIRALTPEKPSKPFAEGKTRDELTIIVNDPATPPDQRAIAQAGLNQINQQRRDDIAAQGAQQLQTQVGAMDYRDQRDRTLKADMAERDLVGVESLIEKMDALVDKVNTSGVAGRVAGLTQRAAQEFLQSDPDVVNLGNISRSYLSIIAKVVQQQSGILSDQDIRRAERAVPLPTDNLETAKQKVADLKDIVGTARTGISRLRGGAAPPSSTAPGPSPLGGPGGGGGAGPPGAPQFVPRR